MKAIMYHYVREKNDELPYFIYLDVNNFEKQINYLKNKYKIIDKDEFENCLKTKKTIPNSIILTFDDGLSDHYKYVYPILKQNNLWGIFYISTFPYKDKTLLDVHRIHYLLGKYDGDEVLFHLLNIISEVDFIPSVIEKFKNKTYINQDNDEAFTKVKQIVNYYIKPEKRTNILKLLMEEFKEDEKKISKHYYLNKKQILEMIEGGMSIGSHSHTHTILSNLSYEKQKLEIEISKKILSNLCNNKEFNSFCYPYGGKHSYDKNTLSILNDTSYNSAFSVESRDITVSDLKNKYELPRYDCNEFKYGKATKG